MEEEQTTEEKNDYVRHEYKVIDKKKDVFHFISIHNLSQKLGQLHTSWDKWVKTKSPTFIVDDL